MQMLRAFLIILSPQFSCGPELLRPNLD